MAQNHSLAISEQLELFLDIPEEDDGWVDNLPLRYEWTEGDIAKLREGILMDALRSLGDGRQGKGSKQETIEWMMSDDIAPFSFVVCCHSEGLIPERVREGVNAMLRKQKQLH
ncbi:MAG: hypothetical protein E7K47_08115 [Acidovorax sp.]|jgi:hypothetical protein|nr:hypothetical protein [Acidovorax sp.]TFI40168.1 topoisomerase II [Diaphorobacter sp. DS2]